MESLNFKPSDYLTSQNVLYCGPTTKPQLPIVQFIVLIAIALATIVLDGFTVGASVVSKMLDKTSGVDILLFAVSLCLHLTPEAVWAIFVIKKTIYEKSKFYVLTDKALVVVYNFKNVETKTIKFENATTVYEKNGALVITFGTGKDEEIEVFKGIPQVSTAVEAINALLIKKD